MSVNQAINLKRSTQDSADGFVKLYARGKIGLLFSGYGKDVHAAEECFKQSLKVSVSLDEHAFAKTMLDQGAPEKVAYKFLENYTIVDEVHLSHIIK